MSGDFSAHDDCFLLVFWVGSSAEFDFYEGAFFAANHVEDVELVFAFQVDAFYGEDVPAFFHSYIICTCGGDDFHDDGIIFEGGIELKGDPDAIGLFLLGLGESGIEKDRSGKKDSQKRHIEERNGETVGRI